MRGLKTIAQRILRGSSGRYRSHSLDAAPASSSDTSPVETDVGSGNENTITVVSCSDEFLRKYREASYKLHVHCNTVHFESELRSSMLNRLVILELEGIQSTGKAKQLLENIKVRGLQFTFTPSYPW